MSILQVVTTPPMFANNRMLALRQRSAPVNIHSEEERKQTLWLIQQLFEVLYTLGTGVGLAAPQLGVLLRIFVIDIDEAEPLALINPEFKYLSPETDEAIEGCLSIPGYIAKVRRSIAVTIQAISPVTWELIDIPATGYLARVLQHEYDHLNGVLFLDHLTGTDALEVAEPYGVVRAQRALHTLKIHVAPL